MTNESEKWLRNGLRKQLVVNGDVYRDPYHKIEFVVTMHFLEKYLPKHGLVLDAGAGPGRYTIELTKRGYKVVLLDYVPEMQKLAKEK